MSKAIKKSTSKPAVKTLEKPAVKKTVKPRRDKGKRLLKMELDAHFLEVGLRALDNICSAHHALKGLVGILDRGDECDIATAHLLRLPVDTLGKEVAQFPDLKKAHKKLYEAQVASHKYYDRDEKGGAQ
jgi:hypothetical protein